MNIAVLLTEAAERGASDIHLKIGLPPVLRIGRELVNTEYAALSAKDMEGFTAELLSAMQDEYFRKHKQIDLAYTSPEGTRFRVDIFYQRGAPGIVMRRVQTEFRGFKGLGLPGILEDICSTECGIVVVCGPARTGKSTTIAEMINYVNSTRRAHIITLEDPIEFLFTDNKSIINQREIGIDTESFTSALKYVVREDPDIVFIGEMRDRESFRAAVTVAETGHLVFTTLHANNSAHAVERILDYFPLDQREEMRVQLSGNLRAVVSQMLLPRMEGKGMVPAVEVMITTGLIQKFIRENKLNKLSAAVETDSRSGMCTFNQSLLRLVKSGAVSEQDALAKSPNPDALKLNLQGIFMDDTKKILED